MRAIDFWGAGRKDFARQARPAPALSLLCTTMDGFGASFVYVAAAIASERVVHAALFAGAWGGEQFRRELDFQGFDDQIKEAS